MLVTNITSGICSGGHIDGSDDDDGRSTRRSQMFTREYNPNQTLCQLIHLEILLLLIQVMAENIMKSKVYFI